MPSSLASITTGPADTALAMAASMSGALEASIGSTGRPTSSPTSARAASPPVKAATAAASVLPDNIALRRTAVNGTSATWATASCTSASRAPCRTSPVTSPRSQACSAPVARANSADTASLRAAWEPAPAMRASASNASCTSVIVRVGSAAGSGSSDRPRQPSPVRRWRSVPPR